MEGEGEDKGEENKEEKEEQLWIKVEKEKVGMRRVNEEKTEHKIWFALKFHRQPRSFSRSF